MRRTRCIRILLPACLFLLFSAWASYSSDPAQTIEIIDNKLMNWEKELSLSIKDIESSEKRLKDLELKIASLKEQLAGSEGESQRLEESLMNYQQIYNRLQATLERQKKEYDELLSKYRELEKSSRSLKTNSTLKDIGLVGAIILIIVLLVT
ncbi:MAG: hypothetical protein JXQ30_08685 [Spirochaetes bacterium]|nr:hypothetical protein [Spirochaetota bacterium]